MFSLIISIISIALVAALALASIYYGGEAFNKGTSDADASTIINQGQQIQAAVTMASVDRVEAKTLADLVTKEYLQEIPQFDGIVWGRASSLDGSKNYALVLTTLDDEVCDTLNLKNNPELTIDESHSERETIGEWKNMFGCDSSSNPYFRIGDVYDSGLAAPIV